MNNAGNDITEVSNHDVASGLVHGQNVQMTSSNGSSNIIFTNNSGKRSLNDSSTDSLPHKKYLSRSDYVYSMPTGNKYH